MATTKRTGNNKVASIMKEAKAFFEAANHQDPNQLSSLIRDLEEKRDILIGSEIDVQDQIGDLNKMIHNLETKRGHTRNAKRLMSACEFILWKANVLKSRGENLILSKREKLCFKKKATDSQMSTLTLYGVEL